MAFHITLGRIAFNLLANSFEITLYTVLRQKIGLKSVVLEAFVIFGMRTRAVAFQFFNKEPEEKNSSTASVISGPKTDQQPVKNSGEKPSGPQVLFFGSEKNAP